MARILIATRQGLITGEGSAATTAHEAPSAMLNRAARPAGRNRGGHGDSQALQGRGRAMAAAPAAGNGNGKKRSIDLAKLQKKVTPEDVIPLESEDFAEF